MLDMRLRRSPSLTQWQRAERFLVISRFLQGRPDQSSISHSAIMSFLTLSLPVEEVTVPSQAGEMEVEHRADCANPGATKVMKLFLDMAAGDQDGKILQSPTD